MTNPRRTNGHRRDQVRRRVLTEEHDCWLCGQPVDKLLKTPHPDSPEVDEVLPVSKGGSPYDRRNCRLAHRRCNRARGAGSPAATTPGGPRTFVTERHWKPLGPGRLAGNARG